MFKSSFISKSHEESSWNKYGVCSDINCHVHARVSQLFVMVSSSLKTWVALVWVSLCPRLWLPVRGELSYLKTTGPY